jgi:hypothetical protein
MFDYIWTTMEVLVTGVITGILYNFMGATAVLFGIFVLLAMIIFLLADIKSILQDKDK